MLRGFRLVFATLKMLTLAVFKSRGAKSLRITSDMRKWTFRHVQNAVSLECHPENVIR